MVFGCVPRYSAACLMLGLGGRPAPLCSCMYRIRPLVGDEAKLTQSVCHAPPGKRPAQRMTLVLQLVVLGLEVAGQGDGPSRTKRLMSEDAPADDVRYRRCWLALH
jgi:hypothetical protein